MGQGRTGDAVRVLREEAADRFLRAFAADAGRFLPFQIDAGGTAEKGWVSAAEVARALGEAGQDERAGRHMAVLMALLFGLNLEIVDEGGRRLDMRPRGQPSAPKRCSVSTRG